MRFFPSPGRLDTLQFPSGEGIRVESGYAQGNQITPYYDPMIGKLIATGPTRSEAIVRLQRALEETCIDGVKTNIDFVRRVLASPEFGSGDVHTSLGAVVQEREKLAAKHSLPDATTRITNA